MVRAFVGSIFRGNKQYLERKEPRHMNIQRIFKGIIVGFGNVVTHSHLPLWRTFPGAEIRAVVEPDASRKGVIHEWLPGIPIYARMDEALEKLRPDFVDICSPSGLHFDHVMCACRQGIAVLCEKPLVTSLQQLHTLEEIIQDRKTPVFTVNNWKHSPLWKFLNKVVDTGVVGGVRRVELEVARPPYSGGGATGWRQDPSLAGGGIIIDHGWHAFYLLLGLLGCPPHSLSCQMEFISPGSGSLDDHVRVELHYPEAQALIHLTWRATRRENRGMLIGTKGSIEINDDSLVIHPLNGSPERVVFDQALSATSHHPSWTKPVLEEFMDVVMGTASCRWDNFTEASWCVRLIHLSCLSHEQKSAHLNVEPLCRTSAVLLPESTPLIPPFSTRGKGKGEGDYGGGNYSPQK
jgi:predicted dehydrogenase